MEKFKRKLAALGIFIVLASSYVATEPHYNPQYELLEDDCAFARCSCGTVYIGDQEFLEQFLCEEGVILIEDQRNSKKNPNMKIYASCSIDDKNDRNDILEIIQEYERQDPTEWDRSIESMRLEWLIHNLSYDLDIQKHRTEDVDLDNLDEDKYDSKLLQLLFRV